MMKIVKITKQNGGQLSHIKYQRRDSRVWTSLFIHFETELEAKTFCNTVGTDPLILAREIVGGLT